MFWTLLVAKCMQAQEIQLGCLPCERVGSGHQTTNYVHMDTVSLHCYKCLNTLGVCGSYRSWISPTCNISTAEQDWPLTSACWVHSNVYGLDNIHCIRYLTAVDPFHSTSSAVHTYHHLTSGSEDIKLLSGFTGYSSSIGKEPVSWSIIIRSATSSLVSYAEQGIITFTYVLQDHVTVILVWSTSEYCSWERRETESLSISKTETKVVSCWAYMWGVGGLATVLLSTTYSRPSTCIHMILPPILG